MKINGFKETAFILIVLLTAAAIRAQRYDGAPPLPVEKLEPNVTQISAVTDARFSPSGKWLVIQTDVGLYVLPVDELDDAPRGFENSRYLYQEGQLKGFLPSDKLIIAARRGLYALDPATCEGRPIYRITAAEEERGDYFGDGEMVAVSEDLIISGDGDYDMGGWKGTILRFDVRRQRVTRGAKIRSFYGGLLSPGGRYVLYEHRGELTTGAAFYDVARNVNHSIPERFDFKGHFPKYKKIDVFAVAWVTKDRFVAVVDRDQLSEDDNDPVDTPAWLAMFDAPAGKIVWKKQLKDDAPVSWAQLGPTKAFFDTGRELYEISLADGRLKNLPAIEGTAFIVQPDKKSMAYLTEKEIFVSSLAGAGKKSIFELPESWRGRPVYDGRGVRALVWSPDGKRLLVFDKNRLLIIRL